jgi:fatty-acyl-CoA synthase
VAGVVNLGRLLTETARRWPDRIGLVQGDRRWTWRQINERVDRTVIALRRLDVGEGDRIVVQSRNNVALFESPWVAFKLGAVWVPTNFRQAPAEIAYVARSSGARVFLYDAGFEQHVDAARAAAPGLEVVVALSGPPRAGEHGHEALIEGIEGFRPASEAEPIEADVVEDDAAWFFYTSGTTGRPKAAELTHAQLAFVVNNHIADLMPGLGPDDASLVVAPLSHGAGLHALSQVARGTKSVLLTSPRLDPEEAWRLVAEHRVTNMFTVPTIVKALVEHEAVDRHDYSSLRHVIYAGAPMYRADQKRALQKLGRVLVQYYGLGEVTGNITWLPPELHGLEDDGDGPAPLNTCGFARTGMEVAIMDPHGVRQGAGVTGEICVRGPAVFKGYYDDPAANAKAFRAGWFRTGDLGHLDGRGFLFITGRASDMFISGGSNVYPREIEEVLLTPRGSGRPPWSASPTHSGARSASPCWSRTAASRSTSRS